jgi:hypothetical protein
VLDRVEDGQRFVAAPQFREARPLVRPHPGEIGRHGARGFVLRERFVEPPGEFERLRVVGASHLQVRMQLDSSRADGQRRGIVTLPEAHERFRHRQQRQQRVDRFAAFQDVERFGASTRRGVQPGEPDMRRLQRRVFRNRLQELRLRFVHAPLEQMQCVRAIAAQFRRQPAEFNGARVDFEESPIHLPRQAHAERRERHTIPDRPTNERRSDGVSVAACSKHSMARSKPSRVRRWKKCHPRRTSCPTSARRSDVRASDG